MNQKNNSLIPDVNKEYNGFIKDLLKHFPSLGTAMGLKEYHERLESLDKEEISESILKAKRHLNKIKNLTPEKRKQNLQMDLMIRNIKAFLRNFEELKLWEKNPYLYVETPIYGIVLILLNADLSLEEKKYYVKKRASFIPKILTNARKNLKPNSVSPTYINLTVASLNGLLNLIEEVDKQYHLETATLNEIKKEVHKFISFLYYIKEVNKEKITLFKLPTTAYENILKNDHFINIQMEDLYEWGKEQFNETKEQLETLSKKIGVSWKEYLTQYKKENKLSENELFKAYKHTLKELAEFVENNNILTLPKNALLKIEKTPSFRRGVTQYAAYVPSGPFAKNQQGVFYVTLVDPTDTPAEKEARLEEHVTYKFVCVHEGIPGHYVQLTYNNIKADGVVKTLSQNIFFVDKQMKTTLTVEGWALYVEELMEEVGYLNSMFDRINRLRFQLWRCARVFLDVGLHLGKIAPMEGAEILEKEVCLPQKIAKREVERYSMRPTQELSYLVGKSLLMQLRKKWLAKNKSKGLKDFHNLFLSFGNMPIPLIAEKLGVKNLKLI